jgi:hypothetical protein
VSFTDLDQGREILSRFSLPKSMKHSVENNFSYKHYYKAGNGGKTVTSKIERMGTSRKNDGNIENNIENGNIEKVVNNLKVEYLNTGS